MKLFGAANIKVVVGRNSRKNMDFDQIRYHLEPYRLNFDMVSNTSLESYCRDHEVQYLIRGLRDMTDANYELDLECYNRKLCPYVQTLLVPTLPRLQKVSSTWLRKLLAIGDLKTAARYMLRDSVFRYIYKVPEFVVFCRKPLTVITFDVRKESQVIRDFPTGLEDYIRVNFTKRMVTTRLWQREMYPIYWPDINLYWRQLSDEFRGKIYLADDNI
jgi:phosphopantetheine adenylyltransferase